MQSENYWRCLRNHDIDTVHDRLKDPDSDLPTNKPIFFLYLGLVHKSIKYFRIFYIPNHIVIGLGILMYVIGALYLLIFYEQGIGSLALIRIIIVRQRQHQFKINIVTCDCVKWRTFWVVTKTTDANRFILISCKFTKLRTIENQDCSQVMFQYRVSSFNDLEINDIIILRFYGSRFDEKFGNFLVSVSNPHRL